MFVFNLGNQYVVLYKMLVDVSTIINVVVVYGFCHFDKMNKRCQKALEHFLLIKKLLYNEAYIQRRNALRE